ncbi:transposase family protein [Streptomyces mirabilis]|uniref:transposase family protein n=1 Tax=Streptomyces mirabilis TaxID=68239 RepID=UPI0033B2A891
MCRQSATVCLVKSPSRRHRAVGDLPSRLATLPDPRDRRGRRHPFVSVLLVACSAVMCGARSFAAIGQWARNAPQDTLARLGARTVSAFTVRTRWLPVRRLTAVEAPG